MSQQPKPEQDKARGDFQDDVKAVLSTKAGRSVILWILGEAGIYRDPFSSEANVVSYTLGQQSIGRRILMQLEAIDPKLYPQLLLEVADNRIVAAEAAANTQPEDDEASYV